MCSHIIWNSWKLDIYITMLINSNRNGSQIVSKCFQLSCVKLQEPILSLFISGCDQTGLRCAFIHSLTQCLKGGRIVLWFPWLSKYLLVISNQKHERICCSRDKSLNNASTFPKPHLILASVVKENEQEYRWTKGKCDTGAKEAKIQYLLRRCQSENLFVFESQ